ncbi:protein-L-isoaspartate(D-aspartate) O-methyltransferase [candidate division KSB1 bacterium]|nr:protein-L-isoaspartate(D-aspartate) O-methyltransferase [candidate division KSB1 bacterium]
MKHFFLWASLLLLISATCKERTEQKNSTRQQDKYERLRNEMVRNQIERRGIRNEQVLDAMRKVPRHEFVPQSLKEYAYRDQPLPIGLEQTISQPFIVAYMTEAIDPSEGDRILEIGTGSAYQAAVLAEIVDEVYTIEIVPELAHQARNRLQRMNYDNVHVKLGDGYKGWQEHAPYDGIIVTAAPDHVPQPLIDQLKPGGRLVIPVGRGYQELSLVMKSEDGEIEKKTLLPVRFVPMTGEAEKK